MTMVTPKTIVITGLPTKTLGPTTTQLSMAMGESLLDGGTRKRKRLTHLSPEERMMRRKLKNRVAAQTARDRKKARMTELEEQLAELVAENRRLQNENNSLRLKTGELASENNNLKERLGMPQCEVQVKSEPRSLESAALADPLQQGQTLAIWRLTAHLASLLLTLSLMHFLSSCKNFPKLETKEVQMDQEPSSPSVPQQQTRRQSHWWGPHQQSWNPSMN